MAERDIAFETLLSAIRSRKLHRFLMITGTVALLLFGSCYLLEGPPVYYSDPIRIRVVDEQTGQPVAGAVAFASWYGQDQLGDGGEYLHVAEGVSNQNGWLTLPGWWTMRPWFFQMTSKDPMIQIYKPGGYWGGEANDGAHQFLTGRDDPWRIKRISFWNGKTISLTPIQDPEFESRIIDGMVQRSHDRRDHGPSELPNVWRAIDTGKDLLSKRSGHSIERR